MVIILPVEKEKNKMETGRNMIAERVLKKQSCRAFDPGKRGHTFFPKCRELVINTRTGFVIEEIHLEGGVCRHCGGDGKSCLSPVRGLFPGLTHDF